MASFEQNLDGDIVINNELTISTGELILALQNDPRFVEMVRLTTLKHARKMGNLFGSYAQQQNPVQTTQKRIQ
jgi:hypothetical protein